MDALTLAVNGLHAFLLDVNYLIDHEHHRPCLQLRGDAPRNLVVQWERFEDGSWFSRISGVWASAQHRREVAAA